jgi:hypothetical protein
MVVGVGLRLIQARKLCFKMSKLKLPVNAKASNFASITILMTIFWHFKNMVF